MKKKGQSVEVAGNCDERGADGTTWRWAPARGCRQEVLVNLGYSGGQVSTSPTARRSLSAPSTARLLVEEPAR